MDEELDDGTTERLLIAQPGSVSVIDSFNGVAGNGVTNGVDEDQCAVAVLGNREMSGTIMPSSAAIGDEHFMSFDEAQIDGSKHQTKQATTWHQRSRMTTAYIAEASGAVA